MKRRVEKDPRILLALGRRMGIAKALMSPAQYDAYKRGEPELRHEAHPAKLVVDKAERLAHLASLPVSWELIDRMPHTGWSALRELSKLLNGDNGDEKLRKLLETGEVNPATKREQIDALRKLQYLEGRSVAPRHPKGKPLKPAPPPRLPPTL